MTAVSRVKGTAMPRSPLITHRRRELARAVLEAVLEERGLSPILFYRFENGYAKAQGAPMKRAQVWKAMRDRRFAGSAPLSWPEIAFATNTRHNTVLTAVARLRLAELKQAEFVP